MTRNNRAVRRPHQPEQAHSGAPTPQRRSEAYIRGYRIVRKIDIGSRSDVYLAYPNEPEASKSDTSSSPSPPIVLKILAKNVPHHSVDNEVRALDAVDSPFVVRLDDVTIDADQRAVLIFPRLAGDSLQQVLRTRDTLEPGESVTILAPVLQAHKDIYTAGFLHGSITTRSIRFDETGKPVVLGLGRVIPETHATPEEKRAELDRALALMRLVLSRIEGDNVSPFLDHLNQISDRDRLGYRVVEILELWREELFAFAEPQPIHFDALRPPNSSGAVASAPALHLPRRLLHNKNVHKNIHHGTHIQHGVGERKERRVDRELHTRLTRENYSAPRGAHDPALDSPPQRSSLFAVICAGLPERFTELIGALCDRVAVTRKRKRRSHNRPRMRLVLFCVCTAAVLTALCVMIVPPSGDASTPSGPPASGPPASPSPAAPPSTTQASPPGDADAIVSDDPTAAAKLLISARLACFTDLSVLCLENVDQSGSPIIGADRAVIRSGNTSDALLLAAVADDSFALVERNGNAALVTVRSEEGHSAGVLIVKGEAGWRVREIFSERPS